MIGRLAFRAALLIVLLAGWRPAQAASCNSPKTKPTVVLSYNVVGNFDKTEASDLRDTFSASIRQVSPELIWNDLKEFQKKLNHETFIQQVGGEMSDVLEDGFRGDYIVQLAFTSTPALSRRAVVTVLSVELGGGLDAATILLPPSAAQAGNVIDAFAEQYGPTLQSLLVCHRLTPVRPMISVSVTDLAQVGTTTTATVRLWDAEDGTFLVNKPFTVEHTLADGTVMPPTTGNSELGEGQVDLPVGNVVGKGKVHVWYTRDDGLVAPSSPDAFYRVVNPLGDLNLATPQAAVHVGDDETVTARLRRNGAPAAGEPVDFDATDGSTEQSIVLTDSAGQATTAYHAPSSDTLVDLSASAPGPGGTTLTASLSLVVDAGVTLTVNADDTIADGFSEVIADLEIEGQVAPGIPIAFTLNGQGALDAPSVTTDATGRAQVAYLAPPIPATVTVTATVVIEGQTYSRTVTIHVGALASGIKAVVKGGGLSGNYAYVEDKIPNDRFNRYEVKCEDPSPYTDVPLDVNVPPAVPASNNACGAVQRWTFAPLGSDAYTLDIDEVNVDGSGDRQTSSGTVQVELTFVRPGTITVTLDLAAFGSPLLQGTGVPCPNGLDGTSGCQASLVTQGLIFIPGTSPKTVTLSSTSMVPIPASGQVSAPVQAQTVATVYLKYGIASLGAGTVSGRVGTITFTPTP